MTVERHSFAMLNNSYRLSFVDNDSCVQINEVDLLHHRDSTLNDPIILFVEHCAIFDSFLKDSRR